MGQFNINISNPNPPYIVSVKKVGDNVERWISGGTNGSGVVTFTNDNSISSYQIILSKNGCTSATATFSLNCSVPTTPTPTITPVPTGCDIVINNINIVCNNSNSATVTVSASSASGKTLRYGILGFVNYQVSNVFELGNSDANGYTFIVAEAGNETVCNATSNRVVNCLVPTPSTPTPVNNCNLTITGVSTSCQGNNNGTLVINVNNPNNYSLEYQIDGYITWQSSGVFTGITNGSSYTVRARNTNNISCEAVYSNVNLTCSSIPTPVTPITPTPVSPSCTLSFSSITTSCQGANNGTITANVNNPDGYSLEYKMDGWYDWQPTNTFSGITNGSNYIIRVRNSNNIACEISNSVAIQCNSVPTPVTPTPITPTPVAPSCNLSITNVTTSCNGVSDGRFVVNVSNPNNYTLQYQIDGLFSWQSSNTFNNIPNGSSYTVRVRNQDNTVCEAVVNNIAIECSSTPTPVTPTPISPVPTTPTPVSPTPTPVPSVPTPVGCPNIVLTNNNVFTTTSSYYTFEVNISGGVEPYTFQTLGNGGNVSPNIFLDPIFNGVNTIKLSPTPLVSSDGEVVSTTYDFGFRVIDANGCVSNVVYFTRPVICKNYTVTNVGSTDLVLSIFNCAGSFVNQITIIPEATSAAFNASHFTKGTGGTIQFNSNGYV